MLEKIITLSRNYLTIKNQSVERFFAAATDLLKHRCSILLGHRGVGKTTILVQQLLRYASGNSLSSEILYVPCDHFLLQGYSLYEIAEQFELLGGKLIAFDEMHKYLNWSKELKSIYDTFPNLIILASGSSALEIHKGSHDLSRRAIIHKIPGLSFREFITLTCNLKLDAYSIIDLISKHERIAQEIIRKVSAKDKKILALFRRYLEIGFFPYFLEIDDTQLYWLTLEQNVLMAIESDLVAIYPKLTGATIKKLKQLLSFIARSVPFTVNWSKIKKVIDVSDDRTLKVYMKYLEDAGLIRSLSRYSKALTKLQAPEKIYLNNPNQIQALSAGAGNKGNIREIFFICMFDLGYSVGLPSKGDFMIDGEYCFEVGGRNKKTHQVKGIDNAYLAVDELEIGINNKIPLWLFGFLY